MLASKLKETKYSISEDQNDFICELLYIWIRKPVATEVTLLK